MNTRKNVGAFGPWGFALAVLAGLALVGAAACRSEAPAPPQAKEELSLAALTPVFGAAEDTRSGLADFTQSDQGIILSYHFYLTDQNDVDRELSLGLAPMIRSLYGRFPNVDRASFEVSLPDLTSPDAWKPYVSFTLTRKIVKEAGWSELLDTDLLNLAIDVKRAY